ncbi:hypothetical protein Q5P01_020963 [Channa striata]|uniref:PDZ domain-containing protein n=1 Tax=Channa striata TaxID=64152 RepID=A0AA88S4D0_CHASR|nr:hypothetical protein Q5P01_020963 [Channa striata]
MLIVAASLTSLLIEIDSSQVEDLGVWGLQSSCRPHAPVPPPAPAAPPPPPPPGCRGRTVPAHSSYFEARCGGTRRRDGGSRRHDGIPAHETFHGHVRSMLGRGVKRKWSCLEELEAEGLPAAAAEEEKQQNGQADEDAEDAGGLPVAAPKSDVSHLQQRQRVLGLCLEKLQRYQAGMELSLRRSVLLINTLRQIQEDMRSDGARTCTTDALLNGVHPDSRLLRDDFREDMSVTCPGCAEGEGDGQCLSPPLSPECPSQESSVSPEQQKSLPASTITAFSDAVNAMGYLSDLALDDIFEDIDTSMYETSDLPSAWGSGSLWPVSVSLWADEDGKMRSPSHGSPGSFQSCLMDLNDLDHIMEILDLDSAAVASATTTAAIMCDCFHLAFPNWHAASSGTGAGRRLRAPEPATEEESICDEHSQFTEGERPRPQGSSPIEEFPETEKYIDSDQECEAEHDPHQKSGSGKKTKKSGLGSMFEKRSTPKMSKVKEMQSPESGVIVKTAKDGCAEGLVYGGGGKDGIFIKEVVPESPASKNLKLQEGDQILSATVYFDNMSYEDAIQILEHARAYKVKLCLKRKAQITETEPAIECEPIPEEELYVPEMRGQGTTKRRGDVRISWPKFPSLGRKARFTRSHSSSEADEQRKLELSPTTSDTESPVKSQDALKGKKRHKMKLSVLTNRGRISSSEDQDTEAPTSGQISSDIHQTVSDMLSPEGLESPSGETLQVDMTEDLKVVEVEQKEPKTVHHKVELISIDSTLKTTDLTAALMDQESLSGMKSPGEKKQKKERERPMIDTAAPKMGVEDTSIDVKMPESEVELDRLGKKFKMPSLGMTMPKVKGPEIHFGISKKGRDVTLPEAEAEVNVPEVQVKEHSANVEVNAPEIKVTAKAKDGSPSKFKLPTLKLPKFGIGTSDTTVEVPHMDKDIKIDGSDINIPEKESAVNIRHPA